MPKVEGTLEGAFFRAIPIHDNHQPRLLWPCASRWQGRVYLAPVLSVVVSSVSLLLVFPASRMALVLGRVVYRPRGWVVDDAKRGCWLGLVYVSAYLRCLVPSTQPRGREGRLLAFCRGGGGGGSELKADLGRQGVTPDGTRRTEKQEKERRNVRIFRISFSSPSAGSIHPLSWALLLGVKICHGADKGRRWARAALQHGPPRRSRVDAGFRDVFCVEPGGLRASCFSFRGSRFSKSLSLSQNHGSPSSTAECDRRRRNP